MIWTVFALFLLLFLLILWVLITPVVIQCDTVANRYEVRQRGVFSLIIRPGVGQVTQFRVMGVKTKFDLKEGLKKSAGWKAKKRKSRVWSGSAGQWILLFRRCSKSLTLRNLIIDIDTGDVVLNAGLVPVACLLTSVDHNRFVSVNFQGRVMVFLKAEWRLYIILIAVVKHLLKR